jgi:hypothetical protein
MEWNDVLLTQQVGPERCMRYVRAAGVSHGSYSKGPEFCFTSVKKRSPVGHETKFNAWQKSLGNQRVNYSSSYTYTNIKYERETNFV